MSAEFWHPTWAIESPAPWRARSWSDIRRVIWSWWSCAH